MARSVRQTMLVLFFALSLTLVPLAGSPVEAAATKWVYIVFPSWLGNCPNQSVVAVQASVSNVWSTNWDAGDDIVYGKVRVNQRQSLTYNLRCKKGWGGSYQAGFAHITPKSDTRTIFVGPAGVQYQR